jgi:hypothetical protein
MTTVISRSANRVSSSLLSCFISLMLFVVGALKRERSCSHLTCLLSSLFFPVATDCNPVVTASASPPTQPTQPTAANPTQAAQPSSTSQSATSRTQIDICQKTSYWNNADVVPCTNNAMCKDYQTRVGTVCCLATRCICGSDANSGVDRCGNFGGVSFANGVTVPTVTSPTTQAIAAVPAPTPAQVQPTPASVPTPAAPTPAQVQPTPASVPTPAAPTPAQVQPTPASVPTPAAPTPAQVQPTPASAPSPANLGPLVSPSGTSSGFDTCGKTSYQNPTLAKTVPCFKASDCANYKPKFGAACCLASRCICGSDANSGADRCANFAPASGATTSSTTGATSNTGRVITVPTVTVPSVRLP